jgi:hypothetical protein
MLWMKAWLETRWRFFFMLALGLLTIVMGEQGGGLGSPANAQNLMLLQAALSIFAAIYLAGAGIRTQSPFRLKAGLHGSTLFTLSMPVSRLQLLATRAVLGLLETASVATLMIVLAWGLFPLVRGNSTSVDLLKLVLTAVICTSCFYFASVTVSTVLDETWQLYGSLCISGLAWFVSTRLGLPSSLNVFGFMAGGSPLLTHSFPLGPMAVSLVASVCLFLAALVLVRICEY